MPAFRPDRPLVSLEELVSFPRNETPNQLTPGTEKSVAGHFALLAFVPGVLRACGHSRKRRRFGRDLMGSEMYPPGYFRTPKICAKTLCVSD